MTPTHLAPTPWMTAGPTRRVLAALEAAGGPACARFVGGCVRDTLLRREAAFQPFGRSTLDIDIATPLTPVEVVAALERAEIRAVPTGIDHGTITAVEAGRPFEITTLRRDVETDGRHAVVAFSGSWEEDAARRDFRLNALYAEPDGRLHDPTGAGVADALAGRVVFVGEASRRIEEDYLRVLRFFRFSAWYGAGPLDADGLAACARLAAGVETLSAERVAKELRKLLAAPDPLRAVEAMAASGVLAHLPLDPDLPRLARLAEREGALGRAPDGDLRLAALSGGDPLALASRLRLPNVLRDRLVAAAGPVSSSDPASLRSAVYRDGARAAIDRLLLAPTSHEADLAPALALVEGFSPPPFPLGGEAIKAAGVPPGPAIGRVRRAVEARWIEANFPEDPDWLAAALRQAAAAEG